MKRKLDQLFIKQQIDKNTWRIVGTLYHVCMYLVIGDKNALLIDTGLGIGNLKDLIRQITDLPLIVVNTHGHPDHVGGNCQFETIWISPKDQGLLTTDMEHRKIIKAMIEKSGYKIKDGLNVNIDDFISENRPDFICTKYLELQDDYVFELGDRQIHAMAMPGHSDGSFTLIDYDNKMAFSGDSIAKNGVLICMQEVNSIELYKKALEKVNSALEEGVLIYSGHSQVAVHTTLIEELILCCDDMITGKKPSRSKSIVGPIENMSLWQHGNAKILFGQE